MSEHAYLPPSSAASWKACPAWPTMNARFPELEADQPALEGIAVHWVNTENLAGRNVAYGTRAPNGVVIDDEMLDGSEVWADAIASVRQQELHVEERLVGRAIHDSLNWGTPDLWTFKAPYLDVYDFKYGHEYVDAFENWQLINYTALILEKMGITGAHDDMVTVRMHVVQPRTYDRDGPIRTWEIKARELRAHFNILRNAAGRATDGNPIAMPGLQCKHCPGRHACTTLQRVAMTSIEQASHVLPVELSPEAVGIELRMLHRAQKLMEARITGLEEQAMGMLRRGAPVPHYMIEQTAGREVWTKPVEEVEMLGQLFGIPLTAPRPITPNQARKAGLDPAVIAAYAGRPRMSIKLAPANNTMARKVFGSDLRQPARAGDVASGDPGGPE